MTSLWPFLQILDLQAVSRRLIPELIPHHSEWPVQLRARGEGDVLKDPILPSFPNEFGILTHPPHPSSEIFHSLLPRYHIFFDFPTEMLAAVRLSPCPPLCRPLLQISPGCFSSNSSVGTQDPAQISPSQEVLHDRPKIRNIPLL